MCVNVVLDRLIVVVCEKSHVVGIALDYLLLETTRETRDTGLD